MKIIIIGYSRHGKDETAIILAERYGLKYENNSIIIAKKLIIPNSIHYKGGLAKTSPLECYKERWTMREEWLQIINKYIENDITGLTEEILKKSDFRVGIRKRKEFNAVKKMVDVVVWVDRPGYQHELYCELNEGDADIILTNNGTLDKLKNEIKKLDYVFINSKKYIETD